MYESKSPAAGTAVNPAMLKASCREFLAAILPGNAPEVQRTEMTQAFYAGAYTAFGFYQGIGEDSVSEEHGVEILTSLSNELGRWREEMEARAKDGRPHPTPEEIP